jgi:hypothetical protein
MCRSAAGFSFIVNVFRIFPGAILRYEKSLLLLQKASWDSRIRTYEMTESESVALPLGYIPR